MDFHGLATKYPVNRPLTQQEIDDHLPTSQPSPSRPHWQFSVIKLNSTFLECCDKFYAWKGALTVFIAPFILLFCWCVVALSLDSIRDWSTYSDSQKSELFWVLMLIYAMYIPGIAFFYWTIRREICRYTHYPMRFNRKTRKVHVFRFDGTIMTETWDKLYFTLGKVQGAWEVRGHRLAEDGKTVLETFGLAMTSFRESDMLCSQWEFIRRYMEEGPEKLFNQVRIPLNIADKRETFWFGFNKMMVSMLSPFIAWPLSPLILLFSVGRWFAMHTSKIPVWPAEIEAESQIEPNDPYIRDAEHLPEGKWWDAEEP